MGFDVKTKGAGVSLAVSTVIGLLFGWWAATLDPDGRGGSILIFPVIATMGTLCVALFIAGAIMKDQSVGPSLILASIVIPTYFIVAGSLLR